MDRMNPLIKVDCLFRLPNGGALILSKCHLKLLIPFVMQRYVTYGTVLNK